MSILLLLAALFETTSTFTVSSAVCDRGVSAGDLEAGISAELDVSCLADPTAGCGAMGIPECRFCRLAGFAAPSTDLQICTTPARPVEVCPLSLGELNAGLNTFRDMQCLEDGLPGCGAYGIPGCRFCRTLAGVTPDVFPLCDGVPTPTEPMESPPETAEFESDEPSSIPAETEPEFYYPVEATELYPEIM